MHRARLQVDAALVHHARLHVDAVLVHHARLQVELRWCIMHGCRLSCAGASCTAADDAVLVHHARLPVDASLVYHALLQVDASCACKRLMRHVTSPANGQCAGAGINC